MILPSVVKETFIFTHKFNFDVREDAAGAITISTAQTELYSLNCSYKTKVTFKNFRTRTQFVRSGQGEGILAAIQMNTI
jgi:hypothetical protein